VLDLGGGTIFRQTPRSAVTRQLHVSSSARRWTDISTFEFDPGMRVLSFRRAGKPDNQNCRFSSASQESEEDERGEQAAGSESTEPENPFDDATQSSSIHFQVMIFPRSKSLDRLRQGVPCNNKSDLDVGPNHSPGDERFLRIAEI
jgi:hypothetical protein